MRVEQPQLVWLSCNAMMASWLGLLVRCSTKRGAKSARIRNSSRIYDLPLPLAGSQSLSRGGQTCPEPDRARRRVLASVDGSAAS